MKIMMEADVVVVAAGMSGLSAAVQAQEALNATGGGYVVAFEKSGTTGGAANMGMAIFAVESKLQKEDMYYWTKDQAFMEFMEYTHWKADAKLVRRWFNMSADTIDWLMSMGTQFQGVYKYFKDSHKTQHIVKMPGTNKPTERCASVNIKNMTDYGLELGVDFQFHTSVKELMMGDKGQVVGVRAVRDDGTEVECMCSTVIIATGGIGNNVDMIEKHLGFKWGQDMFTFRIPGIDGDGMNMAWRIGAKQAKISMEVTYNTPGVTDIFKTLSETMRQPNLMVNLDGKRFMNEYFMDNTTYTGNSLLQQKKNCGFSIIGSDILDYYKENGLDYITYHHGIRTLDKWDYECAHYLSGEGVEASGLSMLHENLDEVEEAQTNFWVCDSLEEVAKVTGINYQNLVATVERYNSYAGGYDADFCKSARYLKAINGPKYYVARHFPSGYGSLGGLQVNENMEVLDKNLDKIPGLYGCGVDTATVFGDSYCFYNPGSTMSYAINSGRIAAMEAVKYIDSDEFVE